jgi:hypothetical protein
MASNTAVRWAIQEEEDVIKGTFWKLLQCQSPKAVAAKLVANAYQAWAR